MRQWTCWHHAARGWLAPNLPAGHTPHVVVRATLGTTASQQQRQGFFRPFVTTKYIIYAVKWRNWRMMSFQNTASLLREWQPSQQCAAWKLKSLKHCTSWVCTLVNNVNQHLCNVPFSDEQVWWLPYSLQESQVSLILSSYIKQHVPWQSSLARAGGRWQAGARDALPYVGMGEAVLPALSSLGVLLLVDGTRETCPWGVDTLGGSCWCCYAHQPLKQTGLLWCHHWGSREGEVPEAWKL